MMGGKQIDADAHRDHITDHLAEGWKHAEVYMKTKEPDGEQFSPNLRIGFDEGYAKAMRLILDSLPPRGEESPAGDFPWEAVAGCPHCKRAFSGPGDPALAEAWRDMAFQFRQLAASTQRMLDLALATTVTLKADDPARGFMSAAEARRRAAACQKEAEKGGA